MMYVFALHVRSYVIDTKITLSTLEAAPEIHRKLELERVHVMARDDQTRILLYQSRDMKIQLTHISKTSTRKFLSSSAEISQSLAEVSHGHNGSSQNVFPSLHPTQSRSSTS
jgi:hypothetical protein